jgi:hypothetical protein
MPSLVARRQSGGRGRGGGGEGEEVGRKRRKEVREQAEEE